MRRQLIQDEAEKQGLAAAASTTIQEHASPEPPTSLQGADQAPPLSPVIPLLDGLDKLRDEPLLVGLAGCVTNLIIA